MASLLCPSDGHRPSGSKTNYFPNLGTWILRSSTDGTTNLVEDGWINYENRATNFGAITDGATNTAVFAESVSGPGGMPQTGPGALHDRLGSVYLELPPSQTPPGQPEVFRDNCQKVNWRTHGVAYNSKGFVWFNSADNTARNLYNHVMAPNGLSCEAHNPAGAFRFGVYGKRAADGIAASSNHPTGANVVFFDDSARFISQTIDWQIWFAMGSIAGGESTQ